MNLYKVQTVSNDNAGVKSLEFYCFQNQLLISAHIQDCIPLLGCSDLKLIRNHIKFNLHGMLKI